MIRRGRINIVDDTGPVQKLQVSYNVNDTQDAVPFVGQFGFTSNPPPGTDVAVAAIAGDNSNSVALGTNNQTVRKRNLVSGESAQYDAFGKYIHLTETAIVVNANGQDVIVNGATNVIINAVTKVRMVTPLLEVTGDIIDNCDIQSNSMNSMRETYNIHKHNGVQTGLGETDVPHPLEV